MCYGEKFNPFYIGPFPECACGDCPYGIYSGFTRCGWTGGNGPFGTTFCDASGDCSNCPSRACGGSGGGPCCDPCCGSCCGRSCDPWGCSWFGHCCSPCCSPGCRSCCRPSRRSRCVADSCVMCCSGLGCCGEPRRRCCYPCC